jgi:hypothetical protein
VGLLLVGHSRSLKGLESQLPVTKTDRLGRWSLGEKRIYEFDMSVQPNEDSTQSGQLVATKASCRRLDEGHSSGFCYSTAGDPKAAFEESLSTFAQAQCQGEGTV